MSKSNQALLRALEKGYTVTEEGVVHNTKGLRSTVTIGTSGYYNLKGTRLPDSRKSVNVPIHRLAAFLKFGDRIFLPGIQVRHLNNDCLDNRWENLEIGTGRDNFLDHPIEKRLALAKAGAASRRKLSSEEAEQLREDRKAGASYKDLRVKYNLAKSTISYVINNKTYKGQQ